MIQPDFDIITGNSNKKKKRNKTRNRNGVKIKKVFSNDDKTSENDMPFKTSQSTDMITSFFSLLFDTLKTVNVTELN